MNEVKAKIDFDPTDKYLKAKKDLIQAMVSINELTPIQQENRVREFVGAEGVAALINFMNMVQQKNQK